MDSNCLKKRKRRPDCHCNLAVRSPTHAFHHHFQVPQLIFSGCHQVQAILGEFSVKSTSINTAQPGLVKKHHFQSIKNDAHWGPPSAAVGATPCSRVFHMVPCAMQAAASEVGLLKKLAVYGTTMIARYHCRLNIRLIYVCNIIYIY